MSIRVVCFGEIMLRLKSPGYERLFQTPLLEASFGGGEANVAVSLANFGVESSFVTVLPQNDIAQACLRELRGFGVDVRDVVRRQGRMGVYYLESGAMQRPSKVIYDRADSCLAQAKPGDIDWERALAGAGWLHVTGITPSLSQGAAQLTLEAMKTAKEKGLEVSCDLNYRRNLWKWGKEAQEVMPGLMRYVDTLIANEEGLQKALGLKGASEGLDAFSYRAMAQSAMAKWPHIKRVAVTLRKSNSASHNDWSACLLSGKDFFLSRTYAMTHIVDRVGGGDSFCAGLIYGLNRYGDEKRALEFAAAASCLKHSIAGDYNRISAAEAEALMAGGGSGRVQR